MALIENSELIVPRERERLMRLLCRVAGIVDHRATHGRRTDEPTIDIDMRVITATLDAPLHDLRELESMHGGKRFAAALLGPDDYAAPQSLGRQLREAGSSGVLYPSVRHAGGFCIGVFRPKALRAARSGAHIALHWDGQRISHWFEKRAPRIVGFSRKSL